MRHHKRNYYLKVDKVTGSFYLQLKSAKYIKFKRNISTKQH